MKIAIASGKGGTGKTTVCASLVSVWQQPVIAVDLDIEEPNLHLFLHPRIRESENGYMDVPEIDTDKCNYCRACAELCQFKAISVFGKVAMTFPEMCHGCGGCKLICPQNAICYKHRVLGEICWGNAGDIEFIMGKLRVGEAMSPPLMRLVKQKLSIWQTGSDMDAIIDSPPGVSCPAVNAVMDTDFIVMVTEPTPFGLYDLKLARDGFSQLDIPMGVVINKAGLGDRKAYDYCMETGLPILAEIPFDRNIANTYAKGQIIADVHDDIKALFVKMADDIHTIVAKNIETKDGLTCAK